MSREDEIIANLEEIINRTEYNKKDTSWTKVDKSSTDFSKLNISTDRDVYLLSKFIYDSFYHAPNPRNSPLDFDFTQSYWSIAEPFVRANIEKKWVFQKKVEGGLIRIRKSTLTQLTGVFEAEKPFAKLEKNNFVEIYPSQKYLIDDGAAHARFFGNFAPEDDDNIVRFYWSVFPNKEWILLNFLKEVLLRLNKRKIIFSIKLLRTGFQIADSIVLYIDKRCFVNFMAVLPELQNIIKPLCLEKINPMFTLSLTNGLSFAEEPVNFNVNPSFGESRCWEIANFLLKSLKKQANLKAELIAYLKGKNFEPNFFYLNQNSTFIFKEPTLSSFPTFTSPVSLIEEKYLNISISIGYKLCNEAIWLSEQNCNWSIMAKAENKTYLTTCNFSLQNGTAGIALYLFQLFYYNPDELFYTTAKGALNHAFEHFSTQTLLGLYDGKAGLLFVVGKVINLLKEFNNTYFDNDIKEYTSFIENNINVFDDIFNINTDFSLKNGLSGVQVVGNQLRRWGRKINLPAFTNFKDFKSELLAKLQDNTNSPALTNELLSSILLALLELNQKLDKNDIKSYISKNDEITEKSIEEILLSAFTAWQKINILFKRFNGLMDVKIRKDFINSINSYNKEVMYHLLIAKTASKNTYTYAGVIGLLDWLWNVGNQSQQNSIFKNELNPKSIFTIVREWADNIEADFLRHDQFPTFDFEYDYHNNGLIDGLAGLGYFYLRLHDSIRVPSPWALTFSTQNFIEA